MLHRGCVFLQIEGKFLHSDDITISFIARLTLLRWSGMKTAISLVCVCVHICHFKLLFTYERYKKFTLLGLVLTTKLLFLK